MLDGVASGAGFVGDGEEEGFIVGQALVAAEILERHAGDACGGENGNLGVAVFSDDVGVDVFRGDAEMLGEAAAEARCVERGAGADDAIRGKSRPFADGIGHDVQRV